MDFNGNNSSVIGSFNVGSFNNWKILPEPETDDKAKALQWLSSLKPQKRHQHLRESRLGGVGRWIFQNPGFQRWNIRGDKSYRPSRPYRSVLFCYGDPGVGKTYISSLVIDHFCGIGGDIAVAGLYCDYLDRKEQTTANMLGAMLRQLIESGNIPEDIRKTFEVAKRQFGGVGPLVPDLLKMLKTALARSRRVILCIDGLDESLAAHRTSLLSSLQTIIGEFPNVRLFLTGRPFIRGELEKYFPGMNTVPVSPTREDTREFLRMKLDGDTEPDAMDKRLRADIMETIPKKISEIFLLISLSIEAILGETTVHRREEKLKQVSKGQGIGDVYTATLARIRAQGTDKSRLGMEAIMWVAHSERPLRPEELCQALAVERGLGYLNRRNVPSIRTILNCGLGLVTVDSSSSTVRLVHFTLQEYILANPTLFHNPHSLIAEICLTYLNFKCIRNLSPSLSSPPPETPFLEYASCCWGAHARRETTENVISLALKLLDQFDAHVSCKLLLLNEREFGPLLDVQGRPTGFTGLHCGALLGVSEIMAQLIQIKRWDFNATDLHGNTALLWAVRGGHGGVLEMLLKQETVNPDIVDNWGTTPLYWAVVSMRVVIVKMLLERGDVNPNGAGKYGITPLLKALEMPYDKAMEIAKMLIERPDLNPNAADQSDDAPLLLAIGLGNKEAVELLLERDDINPDTVDESGRTPLSRAAGWSGCGEIVAMLLKRGDVNAGALDESGRTPLSWAAEEWNVETVAMLLERSDANPDTADRGGRTPFSWAAAGPADWLCDGESGQEGVRFDGKKYCYFTDNQYERVGRMFLERDDINPDRADKGGRTPFSWAASYGNEKVVKMLLERSEVNPDTVDERGRTPLLWATLYGHEGIVRMLLARSEVNPGRPDKTGRTTLSWAAERGEEGVMKMILERNDVNPNMLDGSGRTPLSWAAEQAHEGIAKMLLARTDVDPDVADGSGRTPLLWAAENWRVEVVRILLERSDVNPNTADQSGRPPLSLAASGPAEGEPDWDYNSEGSIYRERYQLYTDNECEKITKMLLARDDITPDTADKRGRTPFSWAASYGHEEMVKMLLGRNDVDPDSVDEKGRTPLSWAAMYGHEEIVSMLLEQNKVNPDARDRTGRTPLSWAAECGGEGVVRMLLERSDVYPDAADESGRTPLLLAAMYSRSETVKLLLERNDVNPETVDKDGRTPLSYAQQFWDGEIVDMLLERSSACPDTVEECGAQLLQAVVNRHDGITDMSLDQCEPGRGVPHGIKGTAFPWVLGGGGHQGSQEVSLGRSDVNPETADKDGETPLPYLQEFLDAEIADTFLDLSNAGPATAVENGGTSFQWTAWNGHEGTVNTLLELCEFNRDTVRESARAPSPQGSGDGPAGVGQLVDAGHELIPESVLREKSSEAFTTETAEPSEPAAKRVRLF